MTTMRLRPLFVLALPAFGSLLSACPSTPARCFEVEVLTEQPTSRFPLGATYYLPQHSDHISCESTFWTLTDAPSGNLNAIEADNRGERFTPHLAGRYVFTMGTNTAELNVVAEAPPYEDFAYYPSRSQARVEGEVWVANALTPTIARLREADASFIERIRVGAAPVAVAHHTGDGEVLVVQRASDTVGFVDIATHRITDAVWVGDEPSNIVLSPDGTRAYVTLATEAKLAVIDVAQHALIARVDTVQDPLGIAISPDGSSVFVASHRSGHPQRFPFTDDPASDERDVDKIDTVSNSVVNSFFDVGTTIGALEMSADGSRLYVSTLRNDTESSLASADNVAFQHFVLALDPTSGAELQRADLGRQASSGGQAVTLHQLAQHEGALWVPAEGSDLTVVLDASTLAEQRRVATPGRPRHALATPSGVFVHGAQSLQSTLVASDGTVRASTPLDTDPRTPEQARGQRYFTGAGRDFADSWSCNSCHADARGDTLVWNAGPLDGHALSRAFFWLEGTAPLGWAGYLSDVRNYAYTVNINVGVRPTTEEALDLTAYLSGLMPPPRGGATTRPDGTHSEEGLRGQEVFNGAGRCASCHAGTLTTSLATLGQGITPGVSDIPSLVGAYRHLTFMKHGEARTLESALDLVLTSTSTTLSAEDRTALLVYLRELQARDFFVLNATPSNGNALTPVDSAVRLTFSAPVWNAPENLSRIVLRAGEAVIETRRELSADGRHLTLTPAAALQPGTMHSVLIPRAFESQDERTLADDARIAFTTAGAPALRLEGEYVWTVDMPTLDFTTRMFDTTRTTPTTVTMRATPTPSGANVVVDYGAGLTWSGQLTVQGRTMFMPALPVPIGPSFADTRGSRVMLTDENADGRADIGTGRMEMTGPGFVVPDVRFTFAHMDTLSSCPEGASGAFPITLGTDAMGRTTISWDSATAGDALSVYVTAPRATIPAGPGATVMGGAYWVAASTMFPMGFPSPVTYGVIPAGARDDGMTHMATFEALRPGGCYKVAVVTTRFSTGQLVFSVP